MLKNWTTFEKVWLFLSTLIILTLSLIWKDTLIGTTASITGILCVVLVAKGKLSSYFFGAIQAATYGYVAYTYQLFGEAHLNWWFFLPIQFIGFFLWYRNRKKDHEVAINGEDIHAKRLTRKQWGVLAVVIVIGYIGYSFYLNSIGSKLAGLDGLAVVLSVVAQLLMIFRYAEQWLLWIVINVLTIILWIVVLLQSGGNDWTVLAMWCAFLFNSIWAYFNWLKISKVNFENV